MLSICLLLHTVKESTIGERVKIGSFSLGILGCVQYSQAVHVVGMCGPWAIAVLSELRQGS